MKINEFDSLNYSMDVFFLNFTSENSSNFRELAALDWWHPPLFFAVSLVMKANSVICVTVAYCCVHLILTF